MQTLPAARTALAGAALALALTGCTDVERFLNQGGDTPCSEYIRQDPDTKRMTITKFVQQQQKSDAQPSGTAVDATMISVDLLCGAQRDAATLIKNADVAGIFLQR